MAVQINFESILETTDRDTVNDLISQIIEGFHFYQESMAKGRGVSIDYLGENIGKITEIKLERY